MPKDDITIKERIKSSKINSGPKDEENIIDIKSPNPNIPKNTISQRDDFNIGKERIKAPRNIISNREIYNTYFGNEYARYKKYTTLTPEINNPRVKVRKISSQPKYIERARIPQNIISSIERDYINDININISRERPRATINIAANIEKNIVNKNKLSERTSLNVISRIKDLVRINYKLRKVLNKNKIEFELIYKGTIDGDSSIKFHEKCDNFKNTLVLIYSSLNKKFGGFTTRTWEGDDINKNDDHCFIFSIEKGIIYDFIEGEDAIKCSKEYGPIFVNQIAIFDKFITQGGIIANVAKNFNMKEDNELLDAYEKFGVKDVEVYHIIS